jgi:Ca2+/Na+ antiporter
MWSALRILAGLVGLLVGAELLVRGSTALASRLGIRPIVIGLTVVSLGTSLPELAIGIDAARQGSPGLAVGNIVGTNLVNILFILGLSAMIRPITFERLTLRFDLPTMTAASLGLWLLALDGSLARVDGIVLCLAGVAYTAGVVWTSRQEPEAVPSGHASKPVAAPARGTPGRGRRRPCRASSGVRPARAGEAGVPGPQGGYLRRSNFRRRWWVPATRAAGVEGLWVHDLRHSAATLALAAGANTRELMERMGHTSPQVALRYQHVMAGRDQAIAAALDELIQAAANLPPKGSAEPPSGTLVARNRPVKSSRSRRSAGEGR